MTFSEIPPWLRFSLVIPSSIIPIFSIDIRHRQLYRREPTTTTRATASPATRSRHTESTDCPRDCRHRKFALDRSRHCHSSPLHVFHFDSPDDTNAPRLAVTMALQQSMKRFTRSINSKYIYGRVVGFALFLVSALPPPPQPHVEVAVIYTTTAANPATAWRSVATYCLASSTASPSSLFNISNPPFLPSTLFPSRLTSIPIDTLNPYQSRSMLTIPDLHSLSSTPSSSSSRWRSLLGSQPDSTRTMTSDHVRDSNPFPAVPISSDQPTDRCRPIPRTIAS